MQIKFANAFESGLKVGAHFLDGGFLRFVEMAAVEAEDLLVAGIHFELAFRGELGGGAGGLGRNGPGRPSQERFGWRESSSGRNNGGTMSELSAGEQRATSLIHGAPLSCGNGWELQGGYPIRGEASTGRKDKGSGE